MVDPALVLRKLAELEEYFEQIKETGHITVSDYRNDWKLQRIIERTLQMMIETCVDIAGHVISDRKYRVPGSYAETFEILHDNKILSDDLSESMQKMAKFRNIVVHHYDKVDSEIVVGILDRNLDDFLKYRDAIVQMIKTES